jgi:UDP-glucose 4-epimerase
MKSRLLVIGGAGYVGSAVAAYLLDRGHEVWVLDDLSTGHRSLILDEVLAAGRFIEARAGDREVVEPLLAANRFDAVLHFAAKSLVAESVRLPEVYRENNVEQTRALLDAMVATNTRNFVFSSTAAVYGDPGDRLLDEEAPKKPVNPYGETKLEVERMLEDYARDSGVHSVALRYFNAAGADEKLRVGEFHEPETHLVPNLLSAALSGRAISLFGDDYPTSDGTCVRDYVYVADLAQAHEAAFLRLVTRDAATPATFEAFNLGSEHGFSVREVIEEAERTLGLKIQRRLEPRRSGDPARLVAVSEKARLELGFSPRSDSLPTILRTAFAWEKAKRTRKKAIFLDRDGTLNSDPGYIKDPSAFELFPGVPQALKRLQDAGYLLIVVSNQSGVGRGIIRLRELRSVHEKLDRLLAAEGVRIHHYALCFHRPEENCDCRKPKPKLILDSAERYAIDLDRSYMIGDKEIDLECGRSAGVRGSFLVGTGYGSEESMREADRDGVLVRDLAEFADRIFAKP